MLPNEMNNKIGLCQSPLVDTTLHRTLEHTFLLLLMLRLDMEVKCGGMEESLLTDVTLEREFSFMLLHVVMHCALDPLRLAAIGTDEVALGILLILGLRGVRRHSKVEQRLWRGAKFQFFRAAGARARVL